MKTLDLSKRHPFIPPDFRGVQYNYHFSAGILECTLRAEESPGQLSVVLRVGEAERRKPDGTFGKTVDVGRSLAADKRTKAKAEVPKGQGDRGDTKR